MRVLYLTARFPSAPGEAFLTAEVAALRALGAELHVVPAVRHLGPVPEGRWQDSFGEVVRCDPVQAWRRAWRHPIDAARVLRIVVPSVMTERTRTAAQGAVRSSVALAVAQQFDGRIDHVHAHWADTPATLAMATAQLLDVPWGFTAHRGDIVAANALDRKVASAAYVHCISSRSRDMLVGRLRSSAAARQKVAVRHLGVDLPAEPVSGCDVRDVRYPLVVCPAQLKPVKGHRFLLEAMAILRDRGVHCRLLVCGEGDLLTELQRRARDLGVSDLVEFTGDLAQPALFRMYRDGLVQAVVLPSIDLGDGEHEGIPASLIEAMAHAVPVISTRTGGIPELITGPTVGTLVGPGDGAALADAIADVLRDSHRARAIGHAAREAVAASWTAERSATVLLRAMQEAA